MQGDNVIELGSWADLTSPVTPPRGASEVPSHIDEMLDSNGVPYYVDRTTGQSAWSPEELTSGGGAADAAEMEAAEMAVTDLADLSVAYDSTGENGTGARPRSPRFRNWLPSLGPRPQLGVPRPLRHGGGEMT